MLLCLIVILFYVSFVVVAFQGLKRCYNDFKNIEILESTSEPFVFEIKIRLQPGIASQSSSIAPTKSRNISRRPVLTVKKSQHNKPLFYQIKPEVIRSFIFNKDYYSVDDFGQCIGDNVRKDSASDNNFFGKLYEGLVYDMDTNSFNIDFIEKHLMIKYYEDIVTANEKTAIAKNYDERKIEASLRKSVECMIAAEQVIILYLLC